PVHAGMLQKLARFHASQKLRFSEENIIFAMYLAGSARPSRTRNGINKIRRLPQGSAQGGLSRARRSRDDKQNPVSAEIKIHCLPQTRSRHANNANAAEVFGVVECGSDAKRRANFALNITPLL